MREQAPLMDIDPLSLPLGMRVGAWRIVGFKGRGAYGSIYRAKWEGHEEAGPFALKLAVYPGDERFEREAWLLSRIHSPHVPRLYAQGVWEHSSGIYPYLVMELVEGEPLYDWAARRNPTQRQVLGLLEQVTRALVATHAVGGLHRDVKGSNVLVRPADGRAYLTDFGAGFYRGAVSLTSKLLPPGTPAYRSPEAWAFLHAFLRHPTAHYPASTCDDLFALGVMAYRLVTDEYPPLTQPHEPGAEVWREGGSGPRPPSALNPRVGPELDGLILRLLSVAPVERFRGKAQEAAEALARTIEEVKPETDGRLFGWDHAPRSGRRSPEAVRLFAERDAAARQEFEQRGAEEQARAAAALDQTRTPGFVSTWRVGGAAVMLGLLLVLWVLMWPHQIREAARSGSELDLQQRGSVAVGDSPIGAPRAWLSSNSRKAAVPNIGGPVPDKPFPGQRKPPCNRFGEVEIRGGCWYPLGGAKPPCKDDAYDWKGACYLPSMGSQRQPNAAPPFPGRTPG